MLDLEHMSPSEAKRTLELHQWIAEHLQQITAIAERSEIAASGKKQQESEPEIVEMVYVGLRTATCLWAVQHGTRTLATTRREKRLYANSPGDYLFSLHETINILERQQMVQKTREELLEEMRDYRQGLLFIEREPDAYVAPDAARIWYEQQIERVRGLLSQQKALPTPEEREGEPCSTSNA